jgi:hypothetical protein
MGIHEKYPTILFFLLLLRYNYLFVRKNDFNTFFHQARNKVLFCHHNNQNDTYTINLLLDLCHFYPSVIFYSLGAGIFYLSSILGLLRLMLYECTAMLPAGQWGVRGSGAALNKL